MFWGSFLGNTPNIQKWHAANLFGKDQFSKTMDSFVLKRKRIRIPNIIITWIKRARNEIKSAGQNRQSVNEVIKGFDTNKNLYSGLWTYNETVLKQLGKFLVKVFIFYLFGESHGRSRPVQQLHAITSRQYSKYRQISFEYKTFRVNFKQTNNEEGILTKMYGLPRQRTLFEQLN